MFFANRWFIAFLALYAFAYHVRCADIGRTNFDYKTNSRSNDKDRNKAKHEDQLPYKLENAPIPSVHDGPQLLRLQNRSEELDDVRRSRRHTPAADRLNPQKPLLKKGISHEESPMNVENQNKSDEEKHFHHPGHSSELSSHHPINSYNYYKVLNTYGSAFQYGNNQPFEGYVQSSNVGIIPPKGVDAKDYYNRLSNLNQYPMISQHSLYDNQNQIYGSEYGYNSRDNLKNAYRNVLTGLAMWGIMNGLVTGKRYTVYDYKTLPQNYNRNITLKDDTITRCLEDVTPLCGDHSKPICINNGTTFCVTSSVIPCDAENGCANITIPCDDYDKNQTQHLPCAVNIVVSKGIFDNYLNTDGGVFTDEEAVLCVTTLVAPHIRVSTRPLCDKPNCVGHNAEIKTNSFDESTTRGV